MPRKSNKRSNKGKITRKQRTKKQKPLVMIGCSKKGKKSCRNNKFFSTLGDESCPNCGPNCHCGPNCNCSHPCSGTCYLNRSSHKFMKKQKGGMGCGSCGCPLAPLSWKEMNQYGGYNVPFPPNSIPHPNGEPVIIAPPEKGYQPILGIGQNGGSCSVCGQTPVVSSYSGGGNFYKPIGPIPGPFVGSPWSPSKLPGENGIDGDRNYLKSYADVITNDPQQQMSMNDAGYKTMNSMVGGYSKNQKKRGGGLIPQDLVNLGRDFTYNFKSAYNTLNGYKAPVDPAPYKGQLTGALNKSILM